MHVVIISICKTLVDLYLLWALLNQLRVPFCHHMTSSGKYLTGFMLSSDCCLAECCHTPKPPPEEYTPIPPPQMITGHIYGKKYGPDRKDDKDEEDKDEENDDDQVAA